MTTQTQKLLTQAEGARALNVCEPRLRKLLEQHSIEPDYVAAGTKLRLYSPETIEGLRRFVPAPQLQRNARAARRRFIETPSQTTEGSR